MICTMMELIGSQDLPTITWFQAELISCEDNLLSERSDSDAPLDFLNRQL